jgi:hypothetical protein
MWVAMARIRLLVAEMRTGSANGDGMTERADHSGSGARCDGLSRAGSAGYRGRSSLRGHASGVDAICGFDPQQTLTHGPQLAQTVRGEFAEPRHSTRRTRRLGCHSRCLNGQHGVMAMRQIAPDLGSEESLPRCPDSGQLQCPTGFAEE